MTRETPFLAYWRNLNAATEALNGAHVTPAVAYERYVARARIDDAAFECAVGTVATLNVSARVAASVER